MGGMKGPDAVGVGERDDVVGGVGSIRGGGATYSAEGADGAKLAQEVERGPNNQISGGGGAGRRFAAAARRTLSSVLASTTAQNIPGTLYRPTYK